MKNCSGCASWRVCVYARKLSEFWCSLNKGWDTLRTATGEEIGELEKLLANRCIEYRSKEDE